MKTSLLCVIVVLNALISCGLQPNVKLTFSNLSKGPSIEYNIEPCKILGYYDSPLHSSMNFEITLQAFQLGSFQELWWSIYMSTTLFTKKFTNCDHLNFSLEEQFQESNENHSIFYQGLQLERVHVFVANLKMKHIMALHGCKNTKRNDRMHQNKMIITLYKYDEAMELNIWNTSFLVYNTMFGYVQMMNEGIEGTTSEENEEIFKNLTRYCHSFAGISDYTTINKTFEGVQRNNHVSWFEYVIPHLIFVIIIVSVLLVCCKRNIFSFIHI